MSEHICKNCGEKNKQKDFCSMTCYLDFEKKKVDLASEAVNNYDRLRKANEELVQLLKEIQPYIGGLSWPGRIQQALQSSEECK